MVIFIIINLVGIEIVRFLCITPVTGSTKSLSLITSFGLEKCSVIPIDIFGWCYFYYCNLDCTMYHAYYSLQNLYHVQFDFLL